MESPYNGERSILYRDALRYTSDQQMAVDVWAAASTPKFQEEVYGPKVQGHRNRLYSQLQGFSPSTEQIAPTIYAGGERLYTLKEDGKIIGQIRTAPYKNGHRVITSNISGQQKQGTGSRVYRAAIEHSLKNGLDLYSDAVLSGQATGVWEKLARFGVARKTGEGYVVPATPFDQNREPDLSEVISFLESQNATQGLDQNEKVELRIALTPTVHGSSDELYQTLRKGFYPQGVFDPTRESLRATGLYNNAEVDNIMSDISLQRDIRDFMQRLRDTPQPVYNDIPVDPRYVATSTLGVDILGKSVTDNPYINEKQALDLLGGIKDREGYEDTLYGSDLDYLKGQEDMFPEFSSYDRARVMDGDMQQVTSYTREILRETVKVPENTSLMDNILYLESVPTVVWETTPDEVKQILKQIRQDAADVAIDLQDLEQRYDDMQREEMLSVLRTVVDYIIAPTEENLGTLAATMDTYHSEDLSPKEKVVRVQPRSRGRALVHMRTDRSPYELFVEHGLLPLGDNVYQTVRNNDDLDLMYNNLYLNILDNPQILPEEAYRTALEEDGSLNRSVLNDPRNRDRVIDDIKNFVQGQTKKIGPGNMENLERMYISAAFFNTKLENTKQVPTIESQVSLIESPIKSQQYLSTEFISDFRVRQIREKQRGSQKYRDYYSNLRVTRSGIEPINDDPISMARMEPYMDDDMRGYMDLHKENFPRPRQVGDRPIDNNIKRNYYSNYPSALPQFSGDTRTVSNRVLASTSSDGFIRVGDSVYEAVSGTGQYTFYSRLDMVQGDYKVYSTDISAPELDVDISNYGHGTDNGPEVSVNNLYDQEQQWEIDERVECG